MQTVQTAKLELDQAALEVIARELDAKIAAMKNHICCAVENPEHWNQTGHTAQAMVFELRQIEAVKKQVNRALYSI